MIFSKMKKVSSTTKTFDILEGSSWEMDTFHDGIGKVRLIDVMPRLVPENKTADYAIVQSARVSYGNGTKKVEEDTGLVRYLMRNQHWTPFEQCELKFHLVVPMFVFNQIVRHRTANLNVISQRYSIVEDRYYIPKQENIRKQSSVNKQGGDEPVDNDVADLFVKNVDNHQHDTYEMFLQKGISREQSRMILQQNLYTELYWKVDLRNLFNFLKLRLDVHAQWEIRQYANVIYEMTRMIFPIAVKAFDDYIQNSVLLTAVEIKALKGVDIENKREKSEFEQKKKLIFSE